MRGHIAALFVGVAFLSSCGNPPGGDGKLRINVSNLATRDPFTELQLHITKVALFYDAAPPAATGGDCDTPGETLVVSPPFSVVVDLTKAGDSFVGEFSVPAGHISEIRVVSDRTHGVEQGLTRRAHPRIRCGGGDTSGLFSLVPLPGQSIDVVAGDTTQVEVQFDPNRDVTVDGQGGAYGQGGSDDHVPGSCDPGQPCGKPFKLASDYGVLAFVVSAAKDWRDSMANTPVPHDGCFKAVYPDTVWQEVPCVTAPPTPFGPTPHVVGDGSGDFAAVANGPISQVVGSFDSVTGLVSADSTASGGVGPFSLQINPNFFATTSCGAGCTACAGGCTGWQQFVYDGDSRPFAGGPKAYMQYWLVGFTGTCPAGWNTATGAGCFRNSNAIGVPGQVTGLAQMTLVGRTAAPLDTVILLTTGGDLSAAAAAGLVGLQPAVWNTAEFNVFGDGNGSTTTFNGGVAGTTMVVRTAISDGTTLAPVCTNASFTGEMNSLTLVPPCCTIAGAQPAIVFTQSDVPGATSTCPAAACTPGVEVLADTIASSGPNCFGSSATYFFGQATCDPGFTLGTCSATFVNDGSNNGSTCAATPFPAGGCMCQVDVTTPADCVKSVNCHVVVTEVPTAPPVPAIVTNQTAHNGSDCFGTNSTVSFPAACTPGSTLGTCSAHLLTAQNGSTCTAAPIGDGSCGCTLTVTTPADCFKFASCSLIATEVPAAWTPGCSSLQRF